MKRVTDILKGNLLLFFGAILFLLYLNYLALNGGTLAIGIIATVISVYYIVIGILGIFIGNKLNKKVFDVISVCLFALFIFVVNIISFVNMIQVATDPNVQVTFGPTGWIVVIFNLLAALALLAFYPVAKFVKAEGVKKLSYLFAGLFVLGLLLNVLFDAQGFAIDLGDIPFMYVAAFALFAIYLFGSLENAEAPAKEEPKAIEQKEEEKPEEKAEEPAPEEAPAEEAE